MLVPASMLVVVGVAAVLLGAFLTGLSALQLRNVDRELLFAGRVTPEERIAGDRAALAPPVRCGALLGP